jgi:hypothetical protein
LQEFSKGIFNKMVKIKKKCRSREETGTLRLDARLAEEELFHQDHLPGLYKISRLNAVDVHTTGCASTIVVQTIPNHGFVSGFLA